MNPAGFAVANYDSLDRHSVANLTPEPEPIGSLMLRNEQLDLGIAATGNPSASVSLFLCPCHCHVGTLTLLSGFLESLVTSYHECKPQT